MKLKRNISNAMKYNLLNDKDKNFLVEGTLFEIKNENPYTKSNNDSRQWMALIKDIKIFVDGNNGNDNDEFIKVDHMWLFGCKKIIELLKCDNNSKIRICGKINTYIHNDKTKWTLKFPYSRLEIFYPF